MTEPAEPQSELERLVTEAERVAMDFDGAGLERVATALEAWAERLRREPIDDAAVARWRPVLEGFARRCGFFAATLRDCLSAGPGESAAGERYPRQQAPGPAARLVARYG